MKYRNINFTAKVLLGVALLIIGVLPVKSQNVEPTWQSINERGYPQWFADAKLGIFIHWGVYSVPAYAGIEGYGEWYYRGLMVGDTVRINFQRKTYGEGITYRDFDKLFKAELWNPTDWASLFEQSGAKYVLLVSKHHDGYCLWDSKFQPHWNSVVGGPKRNIVSELTDAVREKGLKMGFYYSLTEWTNPKHIWMQDPDDSIANYVESYMIPQFKELVERYKPSVIFTDGEWNNQADDFHAQELIAWYYNTVGQEAIVNDRWGGGTMHGFRTPEYSSGIMLTDRPWAECRGMGRSFAFNRREPLSNYLSSNELIRHFCKLVAAGGGMTLNVGPTADGIIPLLQQERLVDLGNWLKINGEAIYATRPYTHFYEYERVEYSRTDSLINFNWVRNSPHKSISYDNFSAEWTATIVPKYSEKYTFNVEVDDNVVVILGDDTIISHYKVRDDITESNAQEPKSKIIADATLKLEKGREYPIKVCYEEKDKEAKMTLWWKSKSQEKEVLKPSKPFEATYSCMQPVVCYTTKGTDLYAIALKYPDEALVLTKVEKPSSSMRVTMLGCDKELPWKYNDQKKTLTIDTTPLSYSDLKSTAAWVFKMEGR